MTTPASTPTTTPTPTSTPASTPTSIPPSTSTREERIRKLAERLSHEPPEAVAETQPVAAPPKRSAKARPRQRHSLYLDSALLEAVDAALRQVQAELAPLPINKSTFLEQLLRRGLADLDGLAAALKHELGGGE